MKRYSKHNILCHLALLAIAGSVLSACVDDEEMLSPLPSLWTQGLTVQPYIEGSKMATRAYNYYDDDTYNNYPIGDDVPADDELKENDLGTMLDVFIAGQGNDPFWMQYHLVQGQETTNGVAGVQASVLNETADLLAKNWTDVEDPNGHKLVSGQKYDVYVAVNNTATNATIASKEALLALTYNNGAVYKLYGSTTTGAYDASRRMLMDGHIEWTCQNLPLQKIEVPLKRAEAKVVITIDFSPAFMAQLREDTGLETPIGIPTASAPFTGAPAWKYVNWCMDTKVFADGNDITPTLNTDEGRESMTENSLLNNLPYYYYNGKEMQENGTLSTDTNTEVYFTDYDDDTDEFGRKYIDLYPVADELSDGHSVERTANNVPRARLITYTYTTSWDHHADERAPYVLVSYPFYRKKEGVTTVSSSSDLITTFNYYRIPVCDEQANTELKRNYIYKVNAIISGAGSTSFTENEANVKLHYEVLPWTHDADEDVKVKGESFHYFYVTPTTYNLRGDNTQSVNLNYYAAKGDVVKFKNLQVYYYNSGGNKVTIYNSTDTENTNGLTTKSLTNNNAGRNYSVTINNDGTITVSSEALANRAVKYISFTAYMTYVDEEGHTQTMTEDIVIKHFPLDNIQNVEGWYSTKTRTNTMTAYEIVYSQTSPGAGWTRGVQENRDQRNKPDGEGWFSNDYEGSILDYDYTTGSGWNRRYWKYRWSRIPWYRETTQTFSFVDWQETPTGYVIAKDDCMQTKVYQNGRIYFIIDNDITDYISSDPVNGIDKLTREQNYYTPYDIDGYWYYHQYQRIKRNSTNYGNYPNPYSNRWTLNTAGWDYYGNYYTNTSYYEEGALEYFGYLDSKGTKLSGYTNNHMYIIQISSTSDSYILGRPIIDGTTHLSNDHVVSPAFMIASQLGAMSTVGGMNAAKAAQHCSDYVEVATDGTRYTGWRLPTKEEVSVILAYQYDQKTEESMAEVLAAKYYYTLDGTTAENTYEDRTGSDGTFARCVRDLSPEEIAAINSKQ